MSRVAGNPGEARCRNSSRKGSTPTGIGWVSPSPIQSRLGQSSSRTPGSAPSHVTGLGVESLLCPISFGREPESSPKKALDHQRCDEAIVADDAWCSRKAPSIGADSATKYRNGPLLFKRFLSARVALLPCRHPGTLVVGLPAASET